MLIFCHTWRVNMLKYSDTFVDVCDGIVDYSLAFFLQKNRDVCFFLQNFEYSFHSLSCHSPLQIFGSNPLNFFRSNSFFRANIKWNTWKFKLIHVYNHSGTHYCFHFNNSSTLSMSFKLYFKVLTLRTSILKFFLINLARNSKKGSITRYTF